MQIFDFQIREGSVLTTTGNCKISVRINRTFYGFSISGTLEGRPGRLEVCRLPVEDKTLLINNWQSWGPIRMVNLARTRYSFNNTRCEYSRHPLPWLLRQTPFLSDYFIYVNNTLLGFLSSTIGHPFFVVKENHVIGYVEYFQREFESSAPLEKLVIIEGLPLEKALELYASLVREENRTSFSTWNPVGWCSWYQYYGKLTWTDVMKNLELSRKLGMGYQVFQIDDSWQKDIGDWEPNELFPSLEEMASSIASHGYAPGIWLAPFSVAESSSVFKSHPEWVVKCEDGSPLLVCQNWGKKIYALDVTNPEASRWLMELFQKILDAGFRYLKIDFLFMGAVPGVRYKSVTPVEAYRSGLSLIRKCTEGAFLLGCGAPLLPSVGYVDGMRIGPDTAPVYHMNTSDPFEINAYNALKNAIMRHFTHGRWWWNDPDCLLLRLEDTHLDDSARRIYAIATGALDCILIESDALSLPIDRELWLEALSLRGGTAELENIAEDEVKIKVYGSKKGNLEIDLDLRKKDARVKVSSNSLPHRTVVRKDGRHFHYYGKVG